MTYWKAYKDGFHFWSALHEIMNFKVFSILICNASESIYGGGVTNYKTEVKWKDLSRDSIPPVNGEPSLCLGEYSGTFQILFRHWER